MLVDYQALFEEKTKEREAIDHELKTLDFQIVALKTLLRNSGISNGKYSNVGPTKAILDLVETKAPYAPGLLLPQIIEELTREGFTTANGNPKALYNTIYPTCQNLVKQNRLEEGKINGRKSYFKKSE